MVKHWTIKKGDGSEITGIKADLMVYSVLVPIGVTFTAGLVTMGGLGVTLLCKAITKH